VNLRPLLVTAAITLTATAAACNIDGGSHKVVHKATAQDIAACDRAVYGELIRLYPAEYLRDMAPCNHLTDAQWNTIIETDTKDAIDAWVSVTDSGETP
jgi:hypothetical protein